MSQAVEYALRNNGELKAFRLEKGIREGARTKAGVHANPTLDFEAETGALTGSSDENSVSLGISQEVLLGGKRDKRIKIADQELETYRWQLADRERTLRAEVKSTLLEALLAQRRAGLADHAVEVSRQLYLVTKERLAAGDIPELEMDLAKVELARSEGARLQVNTVLNQSQARVWTLMGAPLEEAPAVAGNPDPGAIAVQSLPKLKELALANRSDLRVLEAERRKGEAEIDLARAEAIPNLTAGVVLKRESTAIEVLGVEGKDTAYTVGVRLSIPIPVFDKNQGGIQQAQARTSSSESRLLAARRDAEREVEAAYASYLNSDRVVSLYGTNILPQLEENLKLTQEAYRIGEVGIVAVIQEQKKFFEVMEGFLTAQHDRQLALVKLETAVGTELGGGGK